MHKIVITTHLNADFDSIASVLAATKLYPKAVVVFPGSQEKGVRNFMDVSGKDLLPILTLKELDMAQVETLVVVDTRQKDRIGRLASLLEKPYLKVHCYDHHPQSNSDIHADLLFFRETGANTTMMVELLQGKNILLTPVEATLLALGIYEDTGSFSFPSTKPADFRAAAWLLENHADIKLVESYLAHRLNEQQVELLDELLKGSTIHYLNGIEFYLGSVSSNDYVEDFSLIVHEFMEIRQSSVFFALVRMPDASLIVARSKDVRVDVAAILRELGGGGHQSAASATVHDMTLNELEGRLFSAIQRYVGAEPLAKDFMSYPVLFCSPDTTIQQAHDDLSKYGISILPILQNNQVVGLISRRTIEKAISHGLSREPVSEYMTPDFATVTLDSTLSELKNIIVTKRQRFVPVVEHGELKGVITRTDLLQILSADTLPALKNALPFDASPESLNVLEQRRFVTALIRERCPMSVQVLLKTAGEVAAELGFCAYVAGGFVRDLLLNKPNMDVDIVIEGDGLKFVERFGAFTGAKVRSHSKFQTAVLIFPQGFLAQNIQNQNSNDAQPEYPDDAHIVPDTPDARNSKKQLEKNIQKVDVATARWEYYEYPAALPSIALSSIKLDLFRRDFSINAMAIKLAPAEFGLLIDFFSGQRDMKDKMVRVLHSLSIVDDPTRAFRAVRFESRYGFKIEKNTLKLIKNALKLGVFSELSGQRLLTELKALLSEADPRNAIKRASELNLLSVIHPKLFLTHVKERLLARAYEALAWYSLLYLEPMPARWVVYLLVLCEGFRPDHYQELTNRLGIVGRYLSCFTVKLKEEKHALAKLHLHGSLLPSEIYSLLAPLPIENLLHMLTVSRSESVKRIISRFITELRYIKPETTGKDLKSIGIEPGVIYKKILERLLIARLDGEVANKTDEMWLIRRDFFNNLLIS